MCVCAGKIQRLSAKCNANISHKTGEIIEGGTAEKYLRFVFLARNMHELRCLLFFIRMAVFVCSLVCLSVGTVTEKQMAVLVISTCQAAKKERKKNIGQFGRYRH